MPKNTELEKPFLIKLDTLLMQAIEHERKVDGEKRKVFRADGSIKLRPRAQVLRDLLREAVDMRRLERGEEIPVVIPSTPDTSSEEKPAQ
jgi:hypothetical protein